MLDIMDTLNDWIQPLKNFIIENHTNPVLWISLVLLGLVIFGFTYNSLSSK